MEQLRRMQGEAAQPEGLRLLLHRLARVVDGDAALIDANGAPVPESRAIDPSLLSAIAGDLARIRAGKTHSISVHDGARVVSAQVIGDGVEAPILVVTAGESVLNRFRGLIADAVRLLWFRWQMDTAHRTLQRVDRSVLAVREIVLHLLLLGRADDAQRVADTLQPRLPETATVYIVESKASAREAVVELVSEITGNRAWVVRCPVYMEHVVVLAPGASPDSGPGRTLQRRMRRLAAEHPELRAGVSQVVPLRDVGAAYAQAFHALAVARNGAGSFEFFATQQNLTGVLGDTGRGWAERTLAPLLDFVPARGQDPDGEVLTTTLGSWLNFGTRAARQLKVHRNTLTARMRQVEHVLGRDVHDVATQAELYLALRLRARAGRPPADHSGPGLEEMLAADVVRSWSREELAPLVSGDARLMPTLRAWLDSNIRLEATATALGLSVPAARKRLMRIEQVLERSLLHGPSARYELYFALRIHDELAVAH